LSFFFQSAGNGFAPEQSDSLMLFFKPKTGSVWSKVWSTTDSTSHPFSQAMVAIRDTNFLHSNFQFRFINKASMGLNDDVWNIDYIKINTGRNIFDTALTDIAFTNTPSPILKDYTSIPYRQYLANTSGERSSNFQTTIKNNSNSNQVIANFGYHAREIYTNTFLSSDAGTNTNIASKSTSDITFNTYTSTPAFGLYDKVIFENKFYLESPSIDINKANDTIVGQQVFDNYLAYDDGTAEMSYFLNLFPTLPGKIAIEHHLNQADTLRGLAIYFGRQVPLATYKYFSIVVYKSITYGTSTSDNILYQIDNLQPAYIDTVNHFWIYKFDKPVALTSGTFYIGTIQPALSGSDSLYFGLDRNRQEGNHAYYNVLNVWTPSLVSGAIMMRPILGAAISGSSISENSASSFQQIQINPNPATNSIQIDFDGITKGSYEIFNSLGSRVISGDLTSKNQEIDIRQLVSGVYFIQVISTDTKSQVQKIIKL
jgi:hypothetical protein